MKRMREFIYSKIGQPFLKLLKQGVTPEKLAFTAALGIMISIFPVLGSTTFLCAVAAIISGLNLPAIQAINYLLYPLQIALLIPFYRAGNFLFGNEKTQISVGKVFEMINNDIPGAIKSLWDVTIHAIVVWILIAPPVILLIYLLLRPLFKSIQQNYHQKLKDNPTI